MTKEKLAESLNGREYGNEITRGEKRIASEYGFVVVYGYSDDNVEFRGAIDDEIGCFGGSVIHILPDQILDINHEEECECKYCNFSELKDSSKRIESLWCKEEPYLWTYKTDIPHATFDIMKDGEPFCRGIVFSVKDL